MTPPTTAPAANNLEAFFMPFTANRQFKKNPRMLAKAKGVHYWTPEGRKIIDGTAGLWCVNAGHGREEIKAAIARQLDEMDYAPSFQMGHPKAFELAARHAALLPGDLNHAFYCNSGSEAVDSALKIALAYHRARGEGTRTRFVGRERGYHGVGFGGISVGGMVNNRKWFGAMLPGVDHLPHTHLPQNAFSKGQPEHGVELADELERIVGLHDASNIAAVIVEPCAGSTGYLPPPKGYLAAPAPDLRQARHPADLRRGHHRLRPSRHGLRRRQVRRHSRPDDGRQGHQQRHGADGRRVRAQARVRRPDERAGERHRPVPRLHLLGPSAGLRGGIGGARHLPRREACSSARPSCRSIGRTACIR